jgi:hypothetical protein
VTSNSPVAAKTLLAIVTLVLPDADREIPQNPQKAVTLVRKRHGAPDASSGAENGDSESPGIEFLRVRQLGFCGELAFLLH